MDVGQAQKQKDRAGDTPERALFYVILGIIIVVGAFIILFKLGIFR